MKNLTVLFGLGVAGIAVCLVMSIYTGVKQHQEESTPRPLSIPTPALPQ